ncbi:outer membrane beta-barrel protein [Algoriphagus machipongonensis]|uniref:Outer membrane protein beta-barrel domain-containing protein n=1 Tax=Algoriphagus machipongonensis TaxID=388413 RepID=A3I1T4_9BACT|nr:outer membrane beta-barrel protein [Algoriphagus machipongonensis]EAZ79750.1 hypothetical protein ALPR1_08998 [Algoriphagus machipongonensis]
MKNLLATFILVLAISSFAQAQNSLFSFNYAVTVPMGNTSEFIDNVSGRGFVFEYQKFIDPHWTVGIEAGHTTLYKKEEDKVYTEGTASLSGTQYRYQHSWPILINANYYALRTGILRPYAGVGIGTMASQRKVDMGIFSSDQTHWQFAIKPEVGTLIQPNANMAFRIGAKYLMGFESSDLVGQSNLNFNIGIVFIN